MPRLLGAPLRARHFRYLVANGCVRAVVICVTAWLVIGALRAAGEGSGLLWPACGLIASAVALVALRVRERADAERLGQSYVTAVRLRLFDALAEIPSRGLGRSRHGLTMTRLTSDLGSIKSWVSRGLARTVVASLSLCGAIAVLGMVSPAIALATLVSVALLGLAGTVIAARLRIRIAEARRQRGRLAGQVGEGVLAVESWRQFDRIATEKKRLKRRSRRLGRAMVARAGREAALVGLADAVMPITLTIGLIGLGFGRRSGELEGAGIGAALFVLGLATTALRDLAHGWRHRLVYEQGRTRIDDLLGVPVQRLDREGIRIEDEEPLSIRLHDVKPSPSVAAVTDEILPGEAIVLDGSSGSGKSTLLIFLAGSLDLETGDIFFNGVSIRRFDRTSLRRSIKLVSAELPVIRGTVRENLALGAPELNELRAGRLYHLVDPESSLPDGLDSPVEELGVNLPGTLRSRLRLASALASEPRLLLVDDPALTVDPVAIRFIDEFVNGGRSAVIAGVPLAGKIERSRRWALVRSEQPHGRHSAGSRTP